jgi:hypothetical protein
MIHGAWRMAIIDHGGDMHCASLSLSPTFLLPASFEFSFSLFLRRFFAAG